MGIVLLLTCVSKSTCSELIKPELDLQGIRNKTSYFEVGKQDCEVPYAQCLYVLSGTEQSELLQFLSFLILKLLLLVANFHHHQSFYLLENLKSDPFDQGFELRPRSNESLGTFLLEPRFNFLLYTCFYRNKNFIFPLSFLQS